MKKAKTQKKPKASPQKLAGERPPKEKLNLTIEAFAFGGDGLARHDGKVFFVPHCLPDEKILVQVEKDHGRFAHASLLQLLEPAPYQQASPCPHFARCGGCQWLQVPYERQLGWKKSFIAAAFQKFAHIELPSEWNVIAAPQHAAYRNRIRLKLHHRPQGDFIFGYYEKGSHHLVPIQSCWIAAEPINLVLKALSSLRLSAPQQGAYYELELQHLPGTGDKVSACFLPAAADELVERLRKASFAHPVLSEKLIWAKADDQARLFEEDRGLQYYTHAGQFQQVNREANHYLRDWIERKVLASGAQSILDLFCGSGNFSLALARAGLEVWGLEIGRAAIDCAHINVEKNHLEQVRYACGMAHDLFRIFPELSTKAIDLVIVDPPRKGMAEAVSKVLELEAPHLIYVSCDPNTLARDLRYFKDAGYRLEDIIGLDFFHHSYHIETVVYLKKTKASTAS